MGRYADPAQENPDLIMRCDAVRGCKEQVKYGLQVEVPPHVDGTQAEPVRGMIPTHVCALHVLAFKLDDFMSAARRGAMERYAKENRPVGFKPDFDHARLRHVLVTTPEYRAYLERIGAQRVVA